MQPFKSGMKWLMTGLFVIMLSMVSGSSVFAQSAEMEWDDIPLSTGDATLYLNSSENTADRVNIFYIGPENISISQYRMFQKAYDYKGNLQDFSVSPPQATSRFYFKLGNAAKYQVAIGAFDSVGNLLHMSVARQLDSSLLNRDMATKQQAEQLRVSSQIVAINGHPMAVVLDPQEGSFPSMTLKASIVGTPETLSGWSIEHAGIEESGQAQQIKQVTQHNNASVCDQQLDIAVLVDDSVSMKSSTTWLFPNLEEFFVSLRNSCMNWRVSLNAVTPQRGVPADFQDKSSILLQQLAQDFRFDSVQTPSVAELQNLLESMNWRENSRKVVLLFVDDTLAGNADDYNQLSQSLKARQIQLHGFMPQPDVMIQKLAGNSQGSILDLYDSPTTLLTQWGAPRRETGIVWDASNLDTGKPHQGTLILTVKSETGTSDLRLPFQYTAPAPLKLRLLPGTRLVNQSSWERETDLPLTVKVSQRDPDMTPPRMTLHYRDSRQENWQSVPMNGIGNEEYTGIIPAYDMNVYGVHYYISAELEGAIWTLPSQEPERQPFSVAVTPNMPPQFSHKPPTALTEGLDYTVHVEASDETTFISAIRLYYRVAGTEQYTLNEQIFGRPMVSYEGVIPGSAVTADGLEYYVVIEDNKRTYATIGSQDQPVQVFSVSSKLDKVAFEPKQNERIVNIPVSSSNALMGNGFFVTADSITPVAGGQEASGNVYIGTSGTPQLLSFSGKIKVDSNLQTWRSVTSGTLTAKNIKRNTSKGPEDFRLFMGALTGDKSVITPATNGKYYNMEPAIPSNMFQTITMNGTTVTLPLTIQVTLLDDTYDIPLSTFQLDQAGVKSGGKVTIPLPEIPLKKDPNNKDPKTNKPKAKVAISNAKVTIDLIARFFDISGTVGFTDEYKAAAQTVEAADLAVGVSWDPWYLKSVGVVLYPKAGVMRFPSGPVGMEPSEFGVNFTNNRTSQEIELSTKAVLRDTKGYMEQISDSLGKELLQYNSAGIIYIPPQNNVLMKFTGNGRFLDWSMSNAEAYLKNNGVDFKMKTNIWGVFESTFNGGVGSGTSYESWKSIGGWWTSVTIQTNANFSGNMKVKIPRNIPLVGGKTIGSIGGSGSVAKGKKRNYWMKKWWDWKSINEGKIRIDTDFGVARLWIETRFLPSLKLDGGAKCGSWISWLGCRVMVGDQAVMIMSLGKPGPSRSLSPEKSRYLFTNGRRLSEEYVTITRKAPDALIVVQGTNAVIPEFDVTMPDGTVYLMKNHLLRTELTHRQTGTDSTVPDQLFKSSAERNETVFAFKTPALGDYKVSINNADALGGYELQVVMGNNVPTFQMKTLNLVSSDADKYSFDITYDLDDADAEDTMDVNFYLTRDLDLGSDKIPLVAGYKDNLTEINFNANLDSLGTEMATPEEAEQQTEALEDAGLNKRGTNLGVLAAVDRQMLDSGYYDVIAEVLDGNSQTFYSWRKSQGGSSGKLSRHSALRQLDSGQIEVPEPSRVTGQQDSNVFALQQASPPAKVTGVSATAQDTSALIRWTAPTETNLSSLTITVEDLTDTTLPQLHYVANPSAASYEVTGLVNGHNYGVTTIVTNSDGTGSLPSDFVRVTPGGAGENGTPDLVMNLNESMLVVASNFKSAKITTKVTNIGNRTATSAGMRVYFVGLTNEHVVMDSDTAINSLEPGASQTIEMEVTPGILANFLLKNNPFNLPNQPVQFKIYNTAPLEIRTDNNVGILTQAQFENEESIQVNLSAGWNLIAPPVATSITATANPLFPANNFDSLFGTEAEIWTFRNKEWYSYNSNLASGSLQQIMPGESFWVYVPTSKTVSYTGVPYPFNPDSVAAKIAFKLLATDYDKLTDKGLTPEQISKIDGLFDKDFGSIEEFLIAIKGMLDADEAETFGPAIGE
ncbi:MAG: VWA domain-containing protein, partial [SAR324 cluster bacterium]|nr:VWA domain-containing protein [SAR324 cluster bacterium]